MSGEVDAPRALRWRLEQRCHPESRRSQPYIKSRLCRVGIILLPEHLATCVPLLLQVTWPSLMQHCRPGSVGVKEVFHVNSVLAKGVPISNFPFPQCMQPVLSKAHHGTGTP